MSPRNILAITDFDQVGSGYRNIAISLFTGLAKLGHNVKIVGINYRGEEHNFPFSVIPSRDLQEAHAEVNNISLMTNPDVFVCLLDIPLQIQYFSELKHLQSKMIAVTPLENGPLTPSWAAALMQFKGVFFISELGKQEAIKAGVKKAEHLMVGVDTEFWHPATPEEKAQIRKGMGIADDEFVIMTVAANQERKNLSAAMEIVAGVKANGHKVKYVLVTQENSPYGWKLRELAVRLGINQELIIFERGIPPKDLWGLYAMSDLFLLTSKAEGLGMPILEAMGCGVPVVATDTGAIPELLIERGFIVPPEYTFTDVWGNSIRKMIDKKWAIGAISGVIDEIPNPDRIALEDTITKRARKYVVSRTWDIPVKQMEDTIERVINEQTPQAPNPS